MKDIRYGRPRTPHNGTVCESITDVSFVRNLDILSVKLWDNIWPVKTNLRDKCFGYT